jgi:RNA polymerase sigma-70 factor (ECF subfamily)
MATVVADMNYAGNGGGHLYHHQRVQELTRAIVRCLPNLYRAAFRRIGNVADTEDAVQDALLSAYSHLDQFRGQAQMSTWLTSIVINSARMTRRRSRQVYVPLDEGDQDGLCLLDIVSDQRPSPEEQCRSAEFANLLLQSLARLSPILRQAFQLRDIDGLSTRETAQVLGVSNEAVKTRVSRARIKIKELLPRSLGRYRIREGSAVRTRRRRKQAMSQVGSGKETTAPSLTTQSL